MMLARSAVTRVLLTATAATLVAGLQVPAASAAVPDSYVAMGDSYTAGPLIPKPAARSCGMLAVRSQLPPPRRDRAGLSPA